MGSVSASTHEGMKTHNIQWVVGTVKEKDLGLTPSADRKVSELCGIAASKGNQILGLFRRNIVYKEKELILPLTQSADNLFHSFRIF